MCFPWVWREVEGGRGGGQPVVEVGQGANYTNHQSCSTSSIIWDKDAMCRQKAINTSVSLMMSKADSYKMLNLAC